MGFSAIKSATIPLIPFRYQLECISFNAKGIVRSAKILEMEEQNNLLAIPV